MNIDYENWSKSLRKGLKEKFGHIDIIMTHILKDYMHVEVRGENNLTRSFHAKFTDDPVEIVKNA